ncbi:MAG TPA: DUF222 domain-containing protein [Acidimicrobiia bacterium]|nr:DUF222 domain-containing protein [Acidimicrobiia bacterium]
MENLVPFLNAGSSEALVGELDRLDDGELEQITVAFEELSRRADTIVAHAVAELDRRCVPDRRYALSTKQWLRRFCRQTGDEAASTVSVARNLPSMPTVAKRALAGEVPTSSLREIARVARRYRSDFPEHEEVFADVASHLDVRDLRRVIGYWRQQVDHADVEGEISKRHARRHASIAQTIDGMWHLAGLLDPEAGHTVAAALRSLADPGNLDPSDSRTHGQRMADGLTEIARRHLDGAAAASSGGEKPHVTVTMTHDQLLGPATTSTGSAVALPEIDGTPVDLATIRRLACDSRIVRILIDGEGQPLDVGRAVRTVTPAIRKALDLRDGGCVWRGCDVPLGWCDAHHIRHWADGGRPALRTCSCCADTTIGRSTRAGIPTAVAARDPTREPPDPGLGSIVSRCDHSEIHAERCDPVDAAVHRVCVVRAAPRTELDHRSHAVHDCGRLRRRRAVG